MDEFIVKLNAIATIESGHTFSFYYMKSQPMSTITTIRERKWAREDINSLVRDLQQLVDDIRNYSYSITDTRNAELIKVIEKAIPGLDILSTNYRSIKGYHEHSDKINTMIKDLALHKNNINQNYVDGVKIVAHRESVNLEEKIIIESVVEATLEPVIEAALEPVIEAALEPIIEATLEPVVELRFKPVEPVIEATLEPVFESQFKPVEPGLQLQPIIEPQLKETTLKEPMSKERLEELKERREQLINTTAMRIAKLEERQKKLTEDEEKEFQKNVIRQYLLGLVQQSGQTTIQSNEKPLTQSSEEIFVQDIKDDKYYYYHGECYMRHDSNEYNILHGIEYEDESNDQSIFESNDQSIFESNDQSIFESNDQSIQSIQEEVVEDYPYSLTEEYLAQNNNNGDECIQLSEENPERLVTIFGEKRLPSVVDDICDGIRGLFSKDEIIKTKDVGHEECKESNPLINEINIGNTYFPNASNHKITIGEDLVSTNRFKSNNSKLSRCISPTIGVPLPAIPKISPMNWLSRLIDSDDCESESDGY